MRRGLRAEPAIQGVRILDECPAKARRVLSRRRFWANLEFVLAHLTNTAVANGVYPGRVIPGCATPRLSRRPGGAFRLPTGSRVRPSRSPAHDQSPATPSVDS